MTFDTGFTTEPIDVPVEKGCISVHMPPFSAMVVCGNDRLQNESDNNFEFAIGVPDVDIPEDALGYKFLSGQEIRYKSFTDIKKRAGRNKKKVPPTEE